MSTIQICPNRGTDDRAEHRAAVRLSIREREHLERRAKEHGASVSDVIRALIAFDAESVERARKRRRKSKPLAKSRAR